MAVAEGFQGQLQVAVQSKRRYLEELALPRLKDAFQVFQTLFENLHKVLLRKSLVYEDPYKYEQKIEELTVPPKGPILESEKRDKLSRRLSELNTQIGFLGANCPFTLEFLTLERIRRIIGLVQYVNWVHVVETSPDATTAVLAEMLARVRLSGGDSMSTSIVTNSLRQLEAVSRQALGHLRELLSFQREAYKLALRDRLPAGLAPVLARLYEAGPDKAYARLKAALLQQDRSEPFYRDLVTELLEEEYGEHSAQLRQTALERLRVPVPEKETPRQATDLTGLLREAARLLLPAGGHLAEAVNRLAVNEELLRRGRSGWLGRLRAWMRRVLRGREEKRILEVRYPEGASSATRVERLDLQGFLDQMRRKVALFSALGDSATPAATRLAAASEEGLLAFVGRNLTELHHALRRLEGAAEALRGLADKGQAEELKGIRIELAGLKNCLVRSNKLRLEYLAGREAREEQRQGAQPDSVAVSDQTV